MWIATLFLAIASLLAPAAELPASPGSVVAEAAVSGPPDPSGTTMILEVNGNPVGFQMMYDDGTWEAEVDGQIVAWGTYVMHDSGDGFDYVNESGDGGGGQHGTFTWNDTTGVWDRTYSSHPKAPSMSLVP